MIHIKTHFKRTNYHFLGKKIMTVDVVIVESPAKAKTINKYLGPNYIVFPSLGHVRDLIAKKDSVLPDEDFAMKWSLQKHSAKYLSNISKAIKTSKTLILATDPDREGEAISWHIFNILKQKNLLTDKSIQRIVFNSITPEAIQNAIANPRDLNLNLVNAYLTRRALDYLFGFHLSPILWRKIPGTRSAGRVQSVALRLICNQETKIESFTPTPYWSIAANLRTSAHDSLTAHLIKFQGKKINQFDIKTATYAEQIRFMLEQADFKVESLEKKLIQRHPPPPFITSTLQQKAFSEFGFSASQTMQIAQKLYEGIRIGKEVTGLITYMRTDSLQMTSEAIQSARTVIENLFGKNYIPSKPHLYSKKTKNAQEAHEAIRPTDFKQSPEKIEHFLNTEQKYLYEIIWKRALCSQMQVATIQKTIIEIQAQNQEMIATLKATGSQILSKGFLVSYKKIENNTSLPEITKNDPLHSEKIILSQKMTDPPIRYSEATLIRKLEKLGIGRPSTYASILSILHKREYITIKKQMLIPQSKGRILIAFLENFFNPYIRYDFTAHLEEQLDLISNGTIQWKNVLYDFWKEFSLSIETIHKLSITNILNVLNDILAPIIFQNNDNQIDPRSCPICQDGQLSLKFGRYGPFIGCSQYPQCKYTRALKEDQNPTKGTVILLGQDPITREDITIQSGKFGSYIQRGNSKNMKRSSIPKEWSSTEIDIKQALALLSLPRKIGIHPITGKYILANIGRYGPYINHNNHYRNLENIDEVFTISKNQAVTRLNEKEESQENTKTLIILGEHPLGEEIKVKNGRYGPYIQWKKIHVTLSKKKECTLEEAIALIQEKINKSN
ncbi:MAG: DNA topoisomerase I [Candidatus Tokpelaia sp. JSC161]|jgi:DNA topoisomerase-1|nr:MAG: DNA topoisomerase I [Candidatus Tokpelaia sp. JSC161]